MATAEPDSAHERNPPARKPARTEIAGRLTDSGIEVKPVYTALDLPAGELELPGEHPFTRGPYPTMYRGRPWTIRQYAGYGSAEETNARFHYLLARGQTGLSVAFDLPTQLGYDSDDPLAAGEVGRTGVAIDSVADMEVLLDGIPLGEVSTSMTINAPAALLLLLYELVAESQGVPGDRLRGTVQNDVLKEYVARGNYIFPPRPTMRLTTDLFAYCAERLPVWNTISISGYHIREAGASAAQELAFTLSNGIAYCEAAVAAGLSPDAFGERLSFFFNAHNHFFQEVAKFRAARRLWARIMRERFGATNPRATALRFHAQTGGSTLTAQQPENNVVRVAIQALAAVCGGAQSIHTNSFDEALALPSEHAARIALRTQQILAHEAGGTDTADPLGGSYFLEALTAELERRAQELIERVDDLGGAVAAIEQGFVQSEIEGSAFHYQADVEAGDRVVVGVNRFIEEGTGRVDLLQVDPESERRQRERTARVRADRDSAAAESALAEVRGAADTAENLLPPMREALRVRCTVGEICGVLRGAWGTYDAQHG
jgi:methylmalonyl-CoA mutase N-terminal domain/subunit